MASGVTTRCAWPGRGESVTELMPFMNFLVHSYTYCSDRHVSTFWTFTRRWISMGFAPLLLKQRMTERCSSLVLVTSGPPALHYYCAVALHSCILLPPVGHSSNHEYHYCQFTRRSSCVSNFYRTFMVFIWLSLLYNRFFSNSLFCVKNFNIMIILICVNVALEKATMAKRWSRGIPLLFL